MGLGRFPYDLELLLLCLQTPGHFLGTEPFPADDSPIFIPALAELDRAELLSFMSRAAIGSFGLYTFRSKKLAVAGHILSLSYYKVVWSCFQQLHPDCVFLFNLSTRMQALHCRGESEVKPNPKFHLHQFYKGRHGFPHCLFKAVSKQTRRGRPR